MDIAAGDCEFINNVKGSKKIAFDLRGDVKNHAADDVEVICDSFFNMNSHIKQKYDIIFASNVFEHLGSKEEVIAAIRLCAENLTPGGALLVLQPNIKYAKGAYWDFIDHKTPLTDLALIEAAELSGLCAVKRIERFLPYTTKSRIPQHPFLVYLYLKALPLSGFFMGQQSFLVLKRLDDK